MTGRKVKLTLIANLSERKNSYKKRKDSLLKKTTELSILCGVDACAIVNSPFDSEPQICPPSDSGVREVLGKFRALPEWKQNKNMMIQENFITQIMEKNKVKMKNLMKKNKEEEMNIFMFQCLKSGRVENNMTADDYNDLSSVIGQKLKDINTKIEVLKVNNEMTPSKPQMTQPQIQIPSNQTQLETPTLTQTQQNLTLIETPTYQPQMQAPSYQTLMEQPAYLPEMPTLTPEEMAVLNYGPGSDMNAELMQSKFFTDLLNFGDAGFQPEPGFYPNPLP